MEQGGSIANKTGNNLEQFIENALIDREYIQIDKKQFNSALYLEQAIYTKQFYIGKSIYGTSIYCDFIIYHPDKHPNCLVIESKWQQTGGSVDEKYPYTIINIQTKYPYKTILILDGGGYKKGAEEWMRNQIGNNLIHVFSMSEFQTWINKNNI